MADHYLQAIALLDDVEDIRAEIRDVYDAPSIPLSEPLPGSGVTAVRPPWSQQRLRTLQARQRTLLKLAEIHSNLAAAQIVAQALRDSSTSGAVL